jgi:hypothetical protein
VLARDGSLGCEYISWGIRPVSRKVTQSQPSLGFVQHFRLQSTPSMSSSKQKLALSPLDQHAPKVHTRMALVFPVIEYEPAIATLQAALQKVCDQLPYLKGAVIEEDQSHRKQSFIIFDPADAAPQFSERPAPVGMPNYAMLKVDRTPFPPEVFPSPMAAGGLVDAALPVLSGSYTKIEGGLVVCIATNHKVVDGTGYSEILKFLAINSRGDTPVTIPRGAGPDPDEIFTRRQRILGGRTEVSDEFRKLDLAAMLIRHPEYTLKSNINKDRTNGLARAPEAGGIALSSKNTNQVFAFSGRKVEAVKIALAGKLPPSSLTVHNILTAIIWASITHIRATRGEAPITAEISKMDFMVSGRRLVGSSLLDPPFLGNAIALAQIEGRVSELSFMPSLDAVDKLIPIIADIANASAKLTASAMESLVHLSDKNPDLSNITMSWLLNGPGDVHFISWAQVAVYELDFGPTLGQPGFMCSAIIRLNGVVTFLPRRRAEMGAEEMDVSVLLREDDMERISHEATWNGWLTG